MPARVHGPRLRLMWLWLALCLQIAVGPRPWAAESAGTTSVIGASWPAARSALAAMPLPPSPSLSRSNAIRLILSSFVSNGVVRALVVLPGAVDDFHLIHRDVPLPRFDCRNLAEAIEALTNASAWRITFDQSFLLLHTEFDRRTADVRIENPAALSRVTPRSGLPKVNWVDAPWPTVQPILRKALAVSVRPAADSPDAGHFERLNLAAHGLTDWELLQMIALSTGTRLVVKRRQVLFERPYPQ